MNNIFDTPYATYLVAAVTMAGFNLISYLTTVDVEIRWGLLYGVLAGAFGIFLGRAIYCAVQYEDIFYDPMGRWLGLSAFFDFHVGSVSVIGVIAGCLLAAPLVTFFMNKLTLPFLDAVTPALTMLFAFARIPEFLSGQGYGPVITVSWLQCPPIAMQNGWGEWMISIGCIEGLLLLGIMFIVYTPKKRKMGTQFLTGMVLIPASQLILESLRRDNALKIFTFARVNQIGFAVMLFAGCVGAWRCSVRYRHWRKSGWVEVALTVLGFGVLIAGEFALDKTQWPDLAIYLVMTAVLLGIVFCAMRRIIAGERHKLF